MFQKYCLLLSFQKYCLLSHNHDHHKNKISKKSLVHILGGLSMKGPGGESGLQGGNSIPAPKSMPAPTLLTAILRATLWLPGSGVEPRDRGTAGGSAPPGAGSPGGLGGFPLAELVDPFFFLVELLDRDFWDFVLLVWEPGSEERERRELELELETPDRVSLLRALVLRTRPPVR